jgi:hypothetical protein
MHACPYGAVMIGFHKDYDYLGCLYQSGSISTEYVDGTSRDSYPMHVCAYGYAMSGIHVDKDWFTCAR